MHNKPDEFLTDLLAITLVHFLWKKVKKGLSAGRVQSVAVRLIIDREKEIKDFVPEEYWTIEGEFLKGKKLLKLFSMVMDEEKMKLTNRRRSKKY